MTVWDAYLLLLRRLGLNPGPALETGERLPDDLPEIAWMPSSLPGVQVNLWRWVGLPIGCMLTLIGQRLLEAQVGTLGALLLIAGTGLFIFEVWRLGLAGRSPSETGPTAEAILLPGLEQDADVMPVRWQAIILAYIFTGLTFLLSGNNNFNIFATIAWIASLILWVITFWDGSVLPKPARVRNWFGRLAHKQYSIQISRTAVLLVLIMIGAAWFRFQQLDEVPVAMTSDHVEKLLDVNDILNNGRRPIFEPSNGGREPMEFYLAAFTAWAFNTGLTHLTLKLVTSVAGFVAIPFIFLLAREVSDDDLTALLAAAAAISWWPNVISRNGLRFPFAMLFSAITLWLVVRALKRNSQNTVLFAGVLLGIGLYGYTPIRIVPIAVGLAFGLYALHRWNRNTTIKAVAWLAMMAMILLAAFMPMVRYAVDEPENFWRRTATRITGEPGLDTAPATLQVFLSNEWNSLRMFQSTSDSAWLISPAGQPALDWVLGAMFFIGVAICIYRYVRYRQWADLFILLAIPVLLLPSTLALAFPIENPSLHRSGAAIPVVFIFVAFSLRIIWDYARRVVARQGWGQAVGVGVIALLFLISAQENWTILFVRYANQYKSSVQNAPEVGDVARSWAESVGDWDTVVVKAYPYWVDTRAVGFYAGKPGWNNVALEMENLDDLVNDPRPKLYILYHDDADAIAFLRKVYPTGRLAYHVSDYLGKDFLTFSVPGVLDFDETLLRTP